MILWHHDPFDINLILYSSVTVWHDLTRLWDKNNDEKFVLSICRIRFFSCQNQLRNSPTKVQKVLRFWDNLGNVEQNCIISKLDKTHHKLSLFYATEDLPILIYAKLNSSFIYHFLKPLSLIKISKSVRFLNL